MIFLLLLKKRHFNDSRPTESHDRAECGIAKHLSRESPEKMIFLLLKKRHFANSRPTESHDRAECATAKHVSLESTGKVIFSSFDREMVQTAGQMNTVYTQNVEPLEVCLVSSTNTQRQHPRISFTQMTKTLKPFGFRVLCITQK